MRLSRLLLTLPLALASPAALAQDDVAGAARFICGTLTFAPTLAEKKDEMCACVAGLWGNNPPDYVAFLTGYAAALAASDGDAEQAERMLAADMGMSRNDVGGIAALIRAELGNDALECQ